MCSKRRIPPILYPSNSTMSPRLMIDSRIPDVSTIPERGESSHLPLSHPLPSTSRPSLPSPSPPPFPTHNLRLTSPLISSINSCPLLPLERKLARKRRFTNCCSFLLIPTVILSLLPLVFTGPSSSRSSSLSSSSPLFSSLSSSTSSLYSSLTSPYPSSDMGQCPKGPRPEWHPFMDSASKAHLAPIVFTGKLISLSTDYAGRIATTFRVIKQLKNTGSQPGQVPVNLLPGSHATLYFVSKPAQLSTGIQRSQPPHCAVVLNATEADQLRPSGKYIVFASPPLTSLINIHLNQHHRTVPSTSSPSSGFFSASTRVPFSAASVSVSSSSSSSSSSFGLYQRQHVPSFPPSSSPLIGYTTYLSSFSPPDLLTKRATRLIKRTLCDECAKGPQVRGLRGDLRVESKGRLRLRCKVTGNPFPWIEWFRNGKKLNNKGRVSIRTKRKMSLLEIKRVNPSTDSGYFECRAMNVMVQEPAIGKVRVIVTRPSPKTNTFSRDHQSLVGQASSKEKVHLPTPASPSYFSSPFPPQSSPSTVSPLRPSFSQSSPPPSSPTFSSSSQPSPPSMTPSSFPASTSIPITSIISNANRNRDKIPSTVPSSGSGSPSGEWQVRSCPISDFCLNGGQCTFYESVGEYVCHCADGFKGMRCEMKDLFAVYGAK